MLRCPECRTRRVDPRLMSQHRVHCKRPLCLCGGYHYAHRPGSALCEQNPVSILYIAARQGESDESLLRLVDVLVAEGLDVSHAVERLNLRRAA